MTEEGTKPQGDRLEDIVVTPTKYEPRPRRVGWGCLVLFILGAAFIAYNALPGFVYSRRAVNEKKGRARSSTLPSLTDMALWWSCSPQE